MVLKLYTFLKSVVIGGYCITLALALAHSKSIQHLESHSR